MKFKYKVKNIGTTQELPRMEDELNKLGSDSWELIDFIVNEDKTLTGIFRKEMLYTI
ncbi:MAG: hypothetical protein JRD93_11825 [Deltaproteobacteria bacterium]|nr:hypothetical protein [Deltaproteobacteria bacterium]